MTLQNIDLAPTFIRAAGMDVPKSLHGRPLQPLFSKAGPKEWREEILYQYFDGGKPTKTGSLQHAQARRHPKPQVQADFILRIRCLGILRLKERPQRAYKLNR